MQPKEIQAHLGLLRNERDVVSCIPAVRSGCEIVERNTTTQLKPRLCFLIVAADVQWVGQPLVRNGITHQVEIAAEKLRKPIGRR